MRFSLEIGEVKRQRLEYECNELLGRLVIKLNRQVLKRRVSPFRQPAKETHMFYLDADEPTAVRIERERQRLFRSKCLVFLDDRLCGRYVGV